MTVIDGQKVPLNEGLLLWQQHVGGPAVPQCAVLDVLTGEYRPLMSRTAAVNSPYVNRRPTALLFWAQRCLGCRRYLDWFVDFAGRHVLLVRQIHSAAVFFTLNQMFLFNDSLSRPYSGV